MVWHVVEICLVTDSAPNIATDDGTRMAVCTIAHYYSFADQLSFAVNCQTDTAWIKV